jgi:APA family basic amino acid/polyamine antiporter
MFAAFIVALQSVIYTYDGWSAVIYFSEEVKDHGRIIPRAMLGAVATIGGLYILINLAFLAVVSLPTIAGTNFAAGVVFERLFGAAGMDMLRGLVVLVLLSAVSSNVLMAPRVLFAMASDGLFWRGAREVNRGGTPDIALLISSLLAGAFIVTGTFETVVARLAFFFVANYTLSFITLFVLRAREPDTPRPYRAWGHPYTTGLALAGSVIFLVGAAVSDARGTLVAFALLLLSLPIFWLCGSDDRRARHARVELPSGRLSPIARTACTTFTGCMRITWLPKSDRASTAAWQLRRARRSGTIRHALLRDSRCS